MSLQEKFQITVPYNKRRDDNPADGEWIWADAKSVHKGYAVAADPGAHTPQEAATTTHTAIIPDERPLWEGGDGSKDKFNLLPPGMDIQNTLRGPDPHFVYGFGGDTDVSNSADTNTTSPESLRAGFARRTMSSTDDQYTGEHTDLFYGEAVGDDGHVGFIERNNYLDRA
jgi:hypothetical protein